MMVSAFLFLTATLGRTIEPTDREVKAQEAAVLAGCFWDVDAVFKHVKGVSKVISGYSGGNAATSEYELVSAGTTGHAESVEVICDPSVISYSELLKVFFYVAHDPTQLNHQGPDAGTQYRSAIFYANESQKKSRRPT
jgi:peptide-methionine (S)-S-oxide reductase